MLTRSLCLGNQRLRIVAVALTIAMGAWSLPARADDKPATPPAKDVDAEAVKKAAEERAKVEKERQDYADLEKKLADLMNQAHAADVAGKTDEAIALVTKANELAPKSGAIERVLALLYDKQGNYEESIKHYTRWLQLSPTSVEGYDQRGNVYFKMGKANEAIEDYDRFLRLYPERRADHWRRGIVLNYAGRYEDSRDQFELHQTVNQNDVENAVWHFAAVAKLKGIDEARKQLIFIEKDSRPIMMSVYQLFAGKAKPEDVLAAAKQGNPSEEDLKQNLYYANLYLWMYYDALGDQAKAKEHLYTAVDKYPLDSIMGDVGRTYAARFREQEKK